MKAACAVKIDIVSQSHVSAAITQHAACSLFVSHDFPGTSDRPLLNLGSCVKLFISMSECVRGLGGHCEMATALDHRAGQSERTTHRWSIYHGPLVWSCFAASTSLPFIHRAAQRVFDHANVQGTLPSSLGSCSANSLRLHGLVMTPHRPRQSRLIVLIR